VFAAGNTLEGATAPIAIAPEDIGPNEPAAQGPARAGGPSRRANILPRRKRPLEPDYPALLERQGIEADVLVSVHLDASGRVTSVRIVRPARDAEFNAAAIRAAWREVFEPARRGDEPVPYTLSFTYRFRLEER
jgi:protein TonB